MDANCKICLELFSDKCYTVECESDHRIHCDCFKSYLDANVLRNTYQLRKAKCAIRCPVEDCGGYFDTVMAYSKMDKSQKCRYKSITRFVSPEIQKIENLHSSILDTLTLRCPHCRIAVDPSPDACAAVMCLNCGKYYCNCCFLSFPNAVDGQDSAEAHVHTASHHDSESAEERSSFLPEEVVIKGQRIHQANELIKYLSYTMLSDISDHFEKREQLINNITLAFTLAADGLEELDMNIFDIWKSALNIYHAALKQEVSNSGYESTLKRTELSGTVKHIPSFAKPAGIISVSSPSISLPSLWSGGVQLANAIKTGNDVAIGQIVNTYDKETLAIDYIDPQEGLPLTALAISFGNNELALQLIQLGADIMAMSTSGRTVLYVVIETGQAQLLKAVANNNPNLNLVLPLTSEDSNYKALHIAALFNHGHLVKLLLSLGAEIDAKDAISENTPLILALLRSCEWVAQELIAAGADVTAKARNGRSPLYIAAEKGQSSLLELMLLGNEHLIDEEVTIDTKLSLLHVAASYSRSEVIFCLLRLHADPNVQEKEDGHTPLMLSIINGSHSISYELLQSGANCTEPAKNGRTPMYFAIEKGETYLVDQLVRRGINVNAPCTSETSLAKPLHIAIMYGQSHLISFLQRHGADLESLDQDNGCTPLLIAVSCDDATSVAVLLRYGGNPRAANHQGRNSVYISAENGSTGILRLLLTVGRVSPHEPCTLEESKSGPMHVAVQYNKPHIVWELLRLGADPLLRDAFGRTAIDLSKELHVDECREILE